MRSSFPLSLLALTASSVLADVQFVQPAAGTSFKAGVAIPISWKDSGDAPALADLTNYVIQLCAGGNEAGTFIPLTALKSGGSFAAGNTATGVETIDPTLGAVSTNGYFLQITASGSGGTVINYSKRFGLSGMTGTFPANVLTGIADVGSSTAGPSSSDTVVTVPDTNADGDVDTSATASYAIPYNLQQGTMRYAPMQPQPPTKITKKNAKPLNTKSSVQIATSILPIASILTTATQSRVVTVTSIENPATPAAMPNEDMRKWLARWKD